MEIIDLRKYPEDTNSLSKKLGVDPSRIRQMAPLFPPEIAVKIGRDWRFTDNAIGFIQKNQKKGKKRGKKVVKK